MNVEITIDQVVLRGVPPEQAHAVLAALRAGLSDRARDWAVGDGDRAGEGLVDRAEATRRLPGVDAPGGSPADLGRALAAGIWTSVSGAGRRS